MIRYLLGLFHAWICLESRNRFKCDARAYLRYLSPNNIFYRWRRHKKTYKPQPCKWIAFELPNSEIPFVGSSLLAFPLGNAIHLNRSTQFVVECKTKEKNRNLYNLLPVNCIRTPPLIITFESLNVSCWFCMSISSANSILGWLIQ